MDRPIGEAGHMAEGRRLRGAHLLLRSARRGDRGAAAHGLVTRAEARPHVVTVVVVTVRGVLDLLEGALATVAPDLHVEARHVARVEERLLVRDGRVDRVDTETTEGVGVRVRANGAWGFAATADVTKSGAEEALARALALAEALPATGEAPLAPLGAPAQGH